MRKFCQFILGLFALATVSSQGAATSLVWQPDHVHASVDHVALPKLLEQISAVTGWEVYMEPGTTITATAKFKDLPETEALKRLLGNLSFSLTPQSNSVQKLYVFRTNVRQATQLVRAAAPRKGGKIGNELIVGLKKGASIEDLAKKLGAKIIGRSDKLNVYRLQFDSDDAADKARQLLQGDEDVKGVENNIAIDAPVLPTVEPVAATGGGAPSFNLDASPDPNHLTIALIDTHVQALDPSMQKFMLPAINAAGEWAGGPDDPTHGTFMADSIFHAIQAQLAGQNSSVYIQPIDVYGNNSQTTTYDIANAIVLAMQKGDSVINISSGTAGDSAFLKQIISVATEKGFIIAAAAGNTPVTSPTYPASYPGVLDVTASDESGKLAPYANRSASVDFIFPGTDIGAIGTTLYKVSGTSTATAFASGTAAGVMQKQGLSPTGTVNYMTSKWSFQGAK